jgi:hypothetical protein
MREDIYYTRFLLRILVRFTNTLFTEIPSLLFFLRFILHSTKVINFIIKFSLVILLRCLLPIKVLYGSVLLYQKFLNSNVSATVRQLWR